MAKGFDTRSDPRRRPPERDLLLGRPIQPVAERQATAEQSLLTGEPLGPWPGSRDLSYKPTEQRGDRAVANYEKWAARKRVR